jgi:hypothetical protein
MLLTLEAEALGDLECRDDAARFACQTSRQFRNLADTPGLMEVEKPNRFARRVPIKAGSAAFREFPWPVVSDRLVVILHDIPITTNTSMNIHEIGGPIMTPSYDSAFTARFIGHK